MSEHGGLVAGETGKRPSPQRRYDAAFRARAVTRASEPGARITAVATEFGISASTLRRWLATPPTVAPVDCRAVADSHTADDGLAAVAAPQPSETEPRLDGSVDPMPDSSSARAQVDPVADDSDDTDASQLPTLEELPEVLVPEPPMGEAPGSDPIETRDHIFPRISAMRVTSRVLVVLAVFITSVTVSAYVPTAYPGRSIVQALHVISLVVALGPVFVIDWHGLLWLTGIRRLGESIRLASAVGPMIWVGLVGLTITGTLLHPNLGSGLTLTKLLLVVGVALNGLVASGLNARLAKLPINVTRAQVPIREWRLMMTATVISQIGWWGAMLIGLANSLSH